MLREDVSRDRCRVEYPREPGVGNEVDECFDHMGPVEPDIECGADVDA